MLRYEWILEKEHPTGFLNANKMPLKAHENALVFYKQLPTYLPIKTKGHKPVNSFTKRTSDGSNYGATKQGISGGGNTDRYPRSVLKFKYDTQQEALHPTQKPIEMMRYFIETYTNEGETVLDNCMGSGTTAVAALSCGRNFIGIERELKYVEIARKRLQSVQSVMNF